MLVKEYFPGNNTAGGFFSFFHEILKVYEKKFIIKGGPGTGKSTFMKKIVGDLGKKNKMEIFYCASDTESYDAIGFPEIKTIILDGTHPHSIDPSLPGAMEYIVDLGKFLDSKNLSSKKENLSYIQTFVKSHYDIAYSYLKQAREALYREIHLSNSINNWKEINKLKKTLFEIISNESSREKSCLKRSFFLRAYSPEGIQSLMKSLVNKDTKLISISGNITGTNEILKYIKEQLKLKGYSMEIYHHPLDPSLIESIRIPKLNTIYFFKENYPELSNLNHNSSFIEADIPEKNSKNKLDEFEKEELKKARLQNEELINKGIQHLTNMKKIRTDLESIYSSCQDFQAVEDMRLEVIKKINEMFL